MKPVIRIVVAGTGTAVGKTTLASAFLAAARHPTPFARVGLKPIESGYVAETSDAAQLAAAAEHGRVEPRYALTEPVSPHLAALWNGATIRVQEAVDWIAAEEQRAAVRAGHAQLISVVELAGGLFTPLSYEVSNLTLLRALEPCRFVLVAADRLGVLHDVLACVHAAHALHRKPDCVVLNPYAPDHSTPHNLTELRKLLHDIPCTSFNPDTIATLASALLPDPT